MCSDESSQILNIMKSERATIDEYKEYAVNLAMSSPEACHIIELCHDLAKHYEENKDFTRRQVCEGFFSAALELAFGRNDQRYYEDPADERAFHLWAAKRFKMAIDLGVTPQEQEAYEASHGKRPLWMFDKENFREDHEDESKH